MRRSKITPVALSSAAGILALCSATAFADTTTTTTTTTDSTAPAAPAATSSTTTTTTTDSSGTTGAGTDTTSSTTSTTDTTSTDTSATDSTSKHHHHHHGGHHHHADMAMAPAPAMAPADMTPTAVSGTVLNYYVDKAGYVTGATVQGANGPQWVSFPASMAQQLTTTYPVGSNAALFVNSSNQVVGMGATAPTVMPPALPVDMSGNHAGVLTLMAAPYTTVNAQKMSVSGPLTGWVTSKRGEVLALIVNHNTLVRVPPQNRVGANIDDTPEGVRPLFKGELIEAIGYPEAPVFGAISRYSTRLIAYAISVNGESLGARGFGMVMGDNGHHKKGMMMTPYGTMGYTVYSANGTMDDDMTAMPSSSMGGANADSTTTGTTNGGTATGGTGTDSAMNGGTASTGTTDSTTPATGSAATPGS